MPELTVTRNGNLLNIQATQAGAFVIPYTLNGCAGSVCDDGLIRFTIPNCGTLACEGCDIVAIGDFECFPLIPVPVTLFSPEFSLITGGCPEHFTGTNTCGYIFDASQNTPDIIIANSTVNRAFLNTSLNCPVIGNIPSPRLSGNNSIAIACTFNDSGDTVFVREGMVIPLREEVTPGETIDISMFVQARQECLPSNPRVQISFLSTNFRDDQVRSLTQRVAVNQNDAWSGTNAAWEIPARFEIEVDETPTQGMPLAITKPVTDTENWAYLVVYPTVDFVPGGARASAYVLVDDVQVIRQKQITITAAPSTTNICAEGQVTINYELFNDHCSPSNELNIQLTPPAGLILLQAGVFSNGNTFTMPSFAPGERRLVQATFIANAQATVGQAQTVQLTVTPTGCYQPSQNTTAINIINSPLSSLTQTVTENNGVFSFQIEVCNNINSPVEGVLVNAFPPAGFTILDAGLFQVMSNASVTSLALTTNFVAAQGTPVCQTFTYTAQPTGNYCPTSATATATIPSSNCFEQTDADQLEDADLPAINADFTFSVNCLNGGTNFTSATVGAGITHFWNFGDGNTSTDANPVHVFATEGTFVVLHQVTNSCGIVIETQSVTYEPCPANFNCACPNSTSIGSPPSGFTNISQAGIPLNYNNTGQCLRIGGTILIDTNFTLTGGEVVFEPDAEIIVLTGFTLNISGANLHSCDNYMWRGIRVNGSSGLIMNNSIISDATRAVEILQGAGLTLNNQPFRPQLHLGLSF
ncbi:MAG: hypothetical protein HC892_08010 [Saprospiraceae bacterium]|nr:hypothetical protein [Saprospiraceae bacterium]